MKKWSCDNCGFSTGRKWVVDRHIANPNIHNGNANRISYQEYVTGVRTHVLAPPTFAYNTPRYRTTYRVLSNRSHVELGDIMIHIADLIDKHWRLRFKNMFRKCISQDAVSPTSRQVMAPNNDDSLLFLNYNGYICPNCFSIGVTYDNKAAKAIADGDHICPAEFANHSPISSERESAFIKKLRQQLEELLFDVSTTIAAGRKLVLIGQTDYQHIVQFNKFADRSEFREFERRIIFGGGRLELDESTLKEYLRYYSNTINSFDIRFRDEKFTYQLWLAVNLK